jgi:hypothetical protein
MTPETRTQSLIPGVSEAQTMTPLKIRGMIVVDDLAAGQEEEGN